MNPQMMAQLAIQQLRKPQQMQPSSQMGGSGAPYNQFGSAMAARRPAKGQQMPPPPSTGPVSMPNPRMQTPGRPSSPKNQAAPRV